MVFTGTRAEFGLLRPIVDLIESSTDLELQLVVAGSHFSAKYGRTVDEIEAAGTPISWKIDALPLDDSDKSIVQAAAATLSATAEAIDALNPDLAVVLGDRYEALSFATACMLSRVPIAHLHGGEVTEGAVDDSIRHAITQMASIHLVATEEFGARVERMGAQKRQVFVVGAPGLDTVRSVMQQLDEPRKVVEAVVGPLAKNAPLFLVSYHPESRSEADQGEVMRTLLEVLLDVEDSQLLVSMPNADWGREAVAVQAIRANESHPERVRLVRSFGHSAYIAAMLSVDVVVGNSSSAIIEAPFAGTSAVNIGNRQKGRPLAPSIIQSDIEETDIRASVAQALQTDNGSRFGGHYGDGNASDRIVKHLRSFLGERKDKEVGCASR